MQQPSPTRRIVLSALGAAVGSGLASTLTGCSANPSGVVAAGTPSSAGAAASTEQSASSSATPSAPSAPSSASTQGSAGAAPQNSATAGAVPPPGPDITHGPRDRNAVALTFHGTGDATLLRGMLDVLRSEQATVTVLGIGQWLAGEPAFAKLVLNGGHELGNHTWSHQTMPRLTAQQARVEIDKAAKELRTLTGSAGRWFRPSGTPHSTATIRAAATAAGYGACLAYDVDPLDYTDPGPAAILRKLRAGLKSGSIVSLHLGHPGTLKAMPDILSTLHERGLKAVTVSQLLGI